MTWKYINLFGKNAYMSFTPCSHFGPSVHFIKVLVYRGYTNAYNGEPQTGNILSSALVTRNTNYIFKNLCILKYKNKRNALQ